MTVAMPFLPEQAAIVRFLDHADRRIRRYIGAKEKLIALLEEQKKALMYEAVTGRILPSGRTGSELRELLPGRRAVPAYRRTTADRTSSR